MSSRKSRSLTAWEIVQRAGFYVLAVSVVSTLLIIFTITFQAIT